MIGKLNCSAIFKENSVAPIAGTGNPPVAITRAFDFSIPWLVFTIQV